MLLLLSLALATNAMLIHPRAHHSQSPTPFMESEVQYGKDSRGIDARKLTNKPSEYQRKQAERAEIEREESAARAVFAKQEQRAQEAQALYAANVQKAAEKLRKQREFDARQETEAADDKQARIAAEAALWESKHAAEAAAVELLRLAQEAQQIEHIRALNAGVFAARELGIQRNQEEYNARYEEIRARVEAARFMERRIQLEGERLRELTDSALAMADSVQAATDAARWAPRFERMEEEAEQDELQQAFRDRRAANKIAVAARNAENTRLAAEAEAARAAKQAERRERQKHGRSMYKRFGETAAERDALYNKFGLTAEQRQAKREETFANMTASFDALSDEVEIENNRPALRKVYDGLMRLFARHAYADRPEEPAFPTQFQPEFKPVEAY